MSFSPGEKLGAYELITLIGAGGMGQVYRARDPRVGRDVAIKVSSDRFTERFDREARAIAALNHPNTCHLYDVGPNYLVMELVEGPTLADRIRQGAIPLDETLVIAQQIADALEAAHDKGITHRDLKPGNIKIKPDGTVKVLDFGLAKRGGTPTVQSDNSPTLTANQTEAGVILGTAAYMSPEQAKGKPVDKRADIWAFGVVLYEMLTGEQLFSGETTTETLAAVLKEPPDFNRVPARVRPLLQSCLQKDPKQRLHDIADWKLLLSVEQKQTQSLPQAKRRRALLWPILAALLLAIIAALAVALLRRAPAELQEVRSQIPQPEGLTFNPGTQATISPDGKWLAFPALGPDNVSRMYLRSIDALEVKPLPGSEGIIGLSPPPFWSYDSRFVVYGAVGKLKKSEITGTPAQTIADTGLPFAQGGTWSREGVIVFGKNGSNLLQVSATGGTPMPVTALAPGETAHRYPQFLPDGRRFLYLRVSGVPEKTGVYVGSIDSKPEEQSMTPLLLTDRQAWWVSSETSGQSFLLMQRETTLLAQPFDTKTLKLSGTPVPVANDVGSFAGATSGLWSISRNGTLLYRSGGSGLPQLVWRDTTGKTLEVSGAAASYGNLSLSPDGRRLAYRLIDTQGNQDIWVRDLARGNDTRLTFDPRRDDAPVWSPDSTKIIFAANRGANMDLYEKNADNSGEERLVFKSDQDKIPTSWSRDGRFLLFNSMDPKTLQDLYVLPLDGKAKPIVFLKSEFQEQGGQFSPDGRWIAYFAFPSGTAQVYVRPFSAESAASAAGPQWMVSTTGGAIPRWTNDGKHLFYFSLNGALMAADILPGSTFQSSTPQRLFSDVSLTPAPYSVSAAGDRFLFQQVATNTGPPPPFTVVLNWMSRLKQ
jgi:eukaryotic-like serine/threonine-protein kinase